MDSSPPGSSVHGIFQARIPQWAAISLSRGSSQYRDQTCVSFIGRQILFPLSHLGSPKNGMCMRAKLLQLCPTVCNPVDHSPPGSIVLGILQARILEWVAMPSSRGSSRPRTQTSTFYISCTGRQVLYC